MKKNVPLLLLLASTLFFIFAKCEDDDIQLADLPDYVQNYLNANYPGAEVEDPEQQSFCTGITIFELDVETSETEKVTLGFDSEGNLLFTAKEINVSALPPSVSATTGAQYPGYNIKEAERLDAPDGSVRYGLTIRKGNSRLEVLLSAEGTVICEQVEDGE